MGLGEMLTNEITKVKNWFVTEAAIKDLKKKELKNEEKSEQEKEWERSYSMAVQNSFSRPQ